MNVVAIAGKVYELTTNQLSSGKSVTKVVVQVYGAGDYVEGKTKPGFIKAEFWDDQSKFVSENFEKGDPIGVTGSWKQRSYQDKAGNNRQDNYIAMGRASFVSNPKSTDAEPSPKGDAVAAVVNKSSGEDEYDPFAGI